MWLPSSSTRPGASRHHGRLAAEPVRERARLGPRASTGRHANVRVRPVSVAIGARPCDRGSEIGLSLTGHGTVVVSGVASVDHGVGRLAQEIGLVGLLPGELGLRAAEVAAAGRLAVDRPAQVEVLDDARRGQREVPCGPARRSARRAIWPVPWVSTWTLTGSETPMA